MRRLVGLDIARCLALVGMVAAHVLVDRTSTGRLTWHAWLVEGARRRCSPSWRA